MQLPFGLLQSILVLSRILFFLSVEVAHYGIQWLRTLDLLGLYLLFDLHLDGDLVLLHHLVRSDLPLQFVEICIGHLDAFTW